MTDKQIKDGIDVSQCECYSIEDNSCNDTLSGSCIKEKCQTFRLLQTIKAKEQECETIASQLDFEVQKKECLEQECEELKETRKNSRCAWKSLEGTFCPEAQQQLDQLKAENDELKSLLEVRIEDLCDSCGASSMKLMPCKVYEKTLTEIKELCKKQDLNQGSRCVHILQKISEVEDETTK